MFGKRKKSPASQPRAQLGVEHLEAREVPSTVVAVSGANLLRFDSSEPGTILGSAPITGLQAGERIVGIDTRPATGELYGLGSSGRLYVISAVSGAALLRATLTADKGDTSSPFTQLNGTRFAIDFNPTVDRIRVVSDTDQNLRINPVTGAVTTDTPLAYATTDSNNGRNPAVGDLAYTNNFAGATSTTLFDIDQTQRTLATQNPPNNGTLNTIGPRFQSAGFDISPDGTAIVADVLGFNQPTYALATVNLTNGQAGDALGYIGDGSTPVQDIALVPSVQFSTELFATNEGAMAVVTVTLTDRTVGAVSVDFATADGNATAGADYLPTAGTLTFEAGETTKNIVIPITNDKVREGDEAFSLTLSNANGAILGANNTAAVRIGASDLLDRAGPRIIGAGETGPSRGITGFVLRFNEDLNPASAINVANYRFTGVTASGQRVPLALASATYDAAARLVDVRVAQPFDQTTFARMEIEVVGAGRSGLADLSGNLLDGNDDGKPGGNALVRFFVVSGPSLTVLDRDGDTATLTIQNGGRLDGIIPVVGRNIFPLQEWVVDPVSERTILGATTTTNSTGDGIVVISEIIGLDHCDIRPLTSTTTLSVNRLTFGVSGTGRL